jgi:ABC-type antimicrobial peptide transport system permease subunit
MLRNYLKIAVRRLRADRVNTGINILGLALGITSCLVIYIFVRYELSFDDFHTDSAQTYRIVEHSEKANGVQYWPTTAYPLADAIRQEFPDVKVTQTAGPVSRVISSQEMGSNVKRFEEKRLLFADKHYLETFDFRRAFTNGIWLAGNVKTCFQQPNAIILTRKSADRYFAGFDGNYEQMIGKVLMLNNKDVLVVSGVLEDPPRNTNLLFEILVNYEFFKNNNQYQATNWSGNYQGITYITLPTNVSQQNFENRLSVMKRKYMNAEDNRRISYFLQPITDIHTNSLYESAAGSYVVSRQMLWGLSSLAVFLILIAAFNFINLTTAQASRRSKEVGVRKVVGSTQSQLLGQFIGETLVISIAAGMLSFGTLQLLLKWLNASLTMINLDLGADFGVFLFGGGLILTVALLAGFYPAVILSKFQPILALKNRGVQRQRFSLREGLIVFQFCITYCLIVAMVVASRQMNFFMDKDLGFEKNAIVTVTGPRNQGPGKLDVFRQELLRNPAISEVSFASGAPVTSNYYGTDFRLKSEDAKMNRQAEMKLVDPEYLSLFGLQTISGNWFTTSNIVPAGKGFNGFVVNEKMVHALGLNPETAIGEIVKINEGEAPILGVVKDFHNMSLQQAITPCVIMCGNTDYYDQIHIKLRTGSGKLMDLPMALNSISQIWKQTFPQDVYQYTFLNESLAKNYLVESLVFDAFRIFAFISIFVACMGLLGLVTFTASQRTKEIGVRKVLGASVAGIVALLSKDFIKLIFISIVISSPLAWYGMNKWLGNFEFKIGIEWWIFVFAGLLSIGIALLTISFQSIKSALMDPVKSLKTE